MASFILASGSPRRAELLRMAGYAFEVVPSHIDESTFPHGEPMEYALILAQEKAKDVARTKSDCFVLGADTIVVSQGEVLGKPVNQENAKAMLLQLSGARHQVMTAFAIAGAYQDSQVVVSDVWFRNLEPWEVDAYLQGDEWRDKAGAYGIQGTAGAFVTRVEGSVSSIIGLPLSEVIVSLQKAGLPGPNYR